MISNLVIYGIFCRIIIEWSLDARHNFITWALSWKKLWLNKNDSYLTNFLNMLLKRLISDSTIFRHKEVLDIEKKNYFNHIAMLPSFSWTLTVSVIIIYQFEYTSMTCQVWYVNLNLRNSLELQFFVRLTLNSRAKWFFLSDGIPES